MSISNKAKSKAKPHSHDDDDDTMQHQDNIKLTTTEKVWCDGCDELEKNDNYQEPTDMCASCFIPIPREQSKKKNDPNNVCPRCGCDTFAAYIKNPTLEQMVEIRKKLEAQTVEQ